VVAQLKTTSATALEKLYNVDRIIIGEWAKVETKINDTSSEYWGFISALLIG